MNRWIKQEHDQLKEFQIRGRVAGDLFPHLAKHFGELAELMKDKLSLLETMEEVRKDQIKRSKESAARAPKQRRIIPAQLEAHRNYDSFGPTPKSRADFLFGGCFLLHNSPYFTQSLDAT